MAAALALAGCGVAAAADAGAGTPTSFGLLRNPARRDAGPAVALPAPAAVGSGPLVVPAPVPLAQPTSGPAGTAPPLPVVNPRHHVAGRPVKVVFIGDSTAYTTAAGLAPSASVYGASVANEGIMGCGVITSGPYDYFGSRYPQVLPQCQTWQLAWAGAMARDNPDVTAIMLGRWELMDRFWQGRWTHVGDPAYDAYLMSLYDQAITIAGSHGAKVALLTDPYFLRGHRPDGGLWPEDDPGRVVIMNGLFRQVAARHPGLVTLVDLGAHLSPGGRMAMSIDGVRIRSDGVHMTPEAGAWTAPWLMPQLVAIGISA